MKASQLILGTQRENPSDAEIISHQLMIRAGLIRQVSSGIYNITKDNQLTLVHISSPTNYISIVSSVIPSSPPLDKHGEHPFRGVPFTAAVSFETAHPCRNAVSLVFSRRTVLALSGSRRASPRCRLVALRASARIVRAAAALGAAAGIARSQPLGPRDG